jgi:Flp pilus assembly protein TadG
MRHHFKTITTKTGALFRRFTGDRGGNVAIVTGLTAIPLLLAAGVAIDVARSSRSQNALQVAVDAAALAVAASDKAVFLGLEDAEKAARKAELKLLAENFLKANYTDVGEDVMVDVDITDELVTVEGSKVYPTTLMNLAGVRSVDLNARAEVNLQGGIAENIEIVLVMDITGSMRGSKLESAKAAAKALIQKVLGDEPSDEKIRFALVPFSGSVNVGADKYASGWIDTAGKASVSKVNFADPAYHNMKGWDDLRFRDSKGQMAKLPWNGCVEARLGDLATNDASPNAKAGDTLFTPYFAPDEPSDGDGYNNNYVADGVSGSDEKRLKNQAKYSGKLLDPSDVSEPGPWYNCAASPIVALTDSRAGIEAGIDAMVARGSTNLPEGLMWGWRVISPGRPYTEGKAFTDKEWRKVVVFMTDGENDVGTNDNDRMPPSSIGTRYTSYGYSKVSVSKNRFGSDMASKARAKLDDNFAKVCTDLKGLAEMRPSPKDRRKRVPSVELYTIAFQPPNEDVTEDLRACASDPELTGYQYFINASNGEELTSAFETIGARLKTMFLSK